MKVLLMNLVQYDFKAQLDTFDFDGEVLEIATADGKPYVPIKRICINLGLDWNGQYQRIKRDEILSEGMCVMHIPSKGGVQETICLPLEYLNGWLFGIESARVAPEVRPGLLRYKRDAYKALFDYFVKGLAVDHQRLGWDDEAREAALLELRKLRTADKALYRRVTDAIVQTSADYEEMKKVAPQRVQSLFARVQDMFHTAVVGKTSQMLVIENADGNKPLCGMVSYDGPPDKITPADVRTGKNFLHRPSFRKLEIMYEALFLFAETAVANDRKLTMVEWEQQLQTLLKAYGYKPFNLYERYRAREADEVAARELKKYKARQKAELESAKA